MKVVKRRDPLRGITMAKAVNSGLQTDGTGVLIRLLRSEMVSTTPEVDESIPRGGGHHWTSLVVLSICGCGLSVFPVELTQLPHIEKLYLNNNKLTVLWVIGWFLSL
ncbi:phospholipase A I-like [Vicia villosa]|uniref:phospholipase A I-like n=1 Tax=Vicia villosa TaxID=3911 RepID=UPI00273A78B1|nr:phospholipase A I-like [Vicia villosa]